MTPKEIWDWVDALSEMGLSDEESLEAGDFFSTWDKDLYAELFQGRGIIANVSFQGGLLLDPDTGSTLVYGCKFKDIVSAYPLRLA